MAKYVASILIAAAGACLVLPAIAHAQESHAYL